MPRRKVYFCPGDCYHFYNQGNNRERVFYERENYLFFLQRLGVYLIPVLDIVAYCLMPTHYHLLVKVKKTSDPSVGVSKAMMQLAVSYTKAINKQYDRVGVLFQGAFQAKHVDHDNYLIHLSRYIHLNPVMAGLVEQPEDWEFSSYHEYTSLRRGTIPTPEVVLSQFPSMETYREFVETYSADKRKIIEGLLFE